MTSLTQQSQKLVDEHLERLRQSLYGFSEGERDDAVAEVRSHIAHNKRFAALRTMPDSKPLK